MRPGRRQSFLPPMLLAAACVVCALVGATAPRAAAAEAGPSEDAPAEDAPAEDAAAEDAAPEEGRARGTGLVYWIPIDDGPQVARGMIDPWTSFFVSRYIQEAQEAKASAIVFAIRSNGGLVDSSMEVSSAIRSVKNIPTVAFVIDRAFSGAALVALACEKVYMEPGSKIGAAQTIMLTSEGKPQPVGEKADSPMRATFRALAQERGRNYALAEAMADPDVEVVRVEVDGEEDFVLQKEILEFQRKMTEEGKEVALLEPVVGTDELLTLTARDALDRFGFIDGIVADRAELLRVIGNERARVVEVAASWPQAIARFLGGMALSGLLVGIAMLGLMMELYSPGKGVGGFVFLFAIGLFFWSRFLAGQAGPVEIVLFLVGIVLLAVEVFLIPGFGVAGLSGIGLLVVSLVLSFLPGDVMPATELGGFPWGQLRDAVLTVIAGMVTAAVALGVLARFLPRMPYFSRLVLAAPGGPAAGAAAAGGGPAAAAGPSSPLAHFVGRRGIARTDLRPAGKVDVEGKLLDAVGEAEFLEKGDEVEIVEASGNRVVVTRPVRRKGDEGGRSGGDSGEGGPA